MKDDYDVIIVGAGLAGGILAGVLAEGGRRVLLLERGLRLDRTEVPTDHLRNHRLALYGDNTTVDPGGHPRVFVDQAGRAHTVLPHDSRYQLNAYTVGGGARVWGMQAWRFHPDDFRMASRYGVPEGSSLADWPISYADLAPYYERAEHEIGVAGDHAGTTHAPRVRDFPLPPVPRSPAAAQRSAGRRLPRRWPLTLVPTKAARPASNAPSASASRAPRMRKTARTTPSFPARLPPDAARSSRGPRPHASSPMPPDVRRA
jgi:choline dehydrogenase-like flavoprotein